MDFTRAIQNGLIQRALDSFRNADRRKRIVKYYFEITNLWPMISIFDDAMNPTEEIRRCPHHLRTLKARIISCLPYVDDVNDLLILNRLFTASPLYIRGKEDDIYQNISILTMKMTKLASPPDEFMKMNNSSIKNILLNWRDADSIMNRKRLEVEVEVEVLICIIMIVAKMRWFTVVDVESKK